MVKKPLRIRLKTNIKAWRKEYLSKCKLQKLNFVMKSVHRGCDADPVNFEMTKVYCKSRWRMLCLLPGKRNRESMLTKE